MTVSELSKKLGLKEINIAEGEREISGAYCGDLLSWVMSRARSKNVWITIMSNVNIVAVASLCDVSAVILAENVELEREVYEKAKSQGINIFSSEKSAFELCRDIGALI